MQSSVRQPISRTSSNRYNETSMAQEVPVTSLPKNRRPGINANSVYPSNSLHNARSRSESGIRSLSSSLPPNPNVTQPRSRSSMAVSTGQLRSMKSQAAEDRRRESQFIKDLAEFLRTKEPPPNNWVSIPEPSESGRTAKKPLWLFQRKSSRKAVGQERQIRLPDSAVATKTLGGHWHIAISIPNEHYPNDGQSGQDNQDLCLDSGRTQRQVVHNRNGTSTITVLKPVNEEKLISIREIPKKSFRESIFGPDKDFATLNSSKSSSGALRPRVQNRQQRNYVVVNSQEDHENYNFDRRHSGGTIYSVKSLDEEPSHSHSQSISMSDNAGLLEDKNGNHSILIRGIEPPAARLSSIQQQLLSPESAVEASRPTYQSTSINRGSQGHRHSLSAISNAQSVTESIDSNFSMGRISIADTAVPCGPSNKTRKSVTQSQPGPPPDRKLPNLPESSSDDGRTIRPLSLPFMQSPTAPTKDSHAAEMQRPTSQPRPENSKPTDSGKEENKNPVKSRRDRVKALRNRDMAAQISQAKRNSDGSQTSTEAATTTTKIDQVQDHSLSSKPVSRHTSIASKRASRRAGSTSPRRRSSFERKRGKIGLSSIMVVATIAPRCEYGVPRSVGSLKSSLAASTCSKTRAGLGSPTPPRSRAPSIASSDDENEDFNSTIPFKSSRRNLAKPNSITFSQTHKRISSTASAPQISSTRKVTPPQKISKSVNHSPKASEDITAVSARTADLEMRLAKVEKSNRAMLQTVSAVLAMGKGLGELGDLLPVISGEPDILKNLGVGLKKAKDIREELSSETSEIDTVTNGPTPKRKIPVGSVAHARHEISKMQRPVVQQKPVVQQRIGGEPVLKISKKAEEIEAVLKRLGMEMPSNLQGTHEVKRRNGLREVDDLMRELSGASRVSLEGERSFDDSHDSLSEYY